MMEYEWFLCLVFFFGGAMIGSFLNVCIVRWPQDKSVVSPGSHCGNCKQPIRWFDNIPLLSYWILGGRCRSCGAKFSLRYWFIELLTAGVFCGFYVHYGWTILLVPYLVMVSGFIVATFVDLEHRIIPDEVSIGGMFVGLALSPLIPQMHGTTVWWQSLLSSVIGVIVGGGTIYLMGMIGEWMFKKEAMGGGDVKLMAMIGAFLGWKLALLTFFISPFFGAVVGIIEKIRTKDNTIAYGPYIVLGALISLFMGERLVRWILSGYTVF